jgi:hypothetical protein
MNLSQETCLLYALVLYGDIGEVRNTCSVNQKVRTLVNYTYQSLFSFFEKGDFLGSKLRFVWKRRGNPLWKK